MYSKTKIKRKTALIIVVLLLIGASLFPFAHNFATTTHIFDRQNFEIISYNKDIAFGSDGSMDVVEKVENKYTEDGANSVFFKEIKYNKQNEYSSLADTAKLLENIRVVVENEEGIVFDTQVDNNTSDHFVGFSYNNDLDERNEPIRCEVEQDCEMVLYHNEQGIDKYTTFTYYYTIEGVVTTYNWENNSSINLVNEPSSISEINWIFLDSQPTDVYNININIDFPYNNFDLEDNNFHIWGYGSRKGEIDFVNERKAIISVPKLRKNELIESRILLPATLFENIENNNIHQTQTNMLSMFLGDADSIEQYSERLIIYERLIISGFFSFIVFILISGYMFYSKYIKQYNSNFFGEYYRELPSENEPAIVGYLYKKSELEDSDLAATILDLIRRKYLILENKGALVNDKDPNFEIKLNNEKKKDDLKDYEKFLISWFIGGIGDGKKVSFKQIKEITKKESGAKKYMEDNKKWSSLLEKETSKFDFFDNKTKKGKKKYSFIGVVGVIFSIVTFLAYVSTRLDYALWSFVGALSVTVSFYLLINVLVRISKHYIDEYLKWKAFKKFLEDFSTFEDYPVPSLVIWEHYLVYATTFNIADKVMEQLKVKFKDFKNIDNSTLTFGSSFTTDIFAILYINSAIRSFRVNSIATRASVIASHGGRAVVGGMSAGRSFGGGGGSFGGR